MNIQSGTYYWPTTMVAPPTYPPLDEDLNCDVLIVGGGSSGAQCAYYLANTDLDVVLIEKNTIGSGSTSSNTAFIQYSGEKLFTDLVHTFGEEYVRRHLELCREAINEMEEASTFVDFDFEFARTDSLYYASATEDVHKLKKEYEFLTKQQFELTYFSSSEIEEKYGFKKHGALYSYNDAVINPFKFTHSLLDYSVKKGVRVFEETEMNGYTYDKNRHKAVIRTKTGNLIHARNVIFCAGYEGMDLKKEKKASFVSTYTVTSKPIKDLSQWYNRTLIWETARPYVFMRTTQDNRVIIGGLDETTIYPEKRDSMLINKTNKLIKEFNKLFPKIQVEADYSIAAYYGGTVDGLPITRDARNEKRSLSKVQ